MYSYAMVFAYLELEIVLNNIPSFPRIRRYSKWNSRLGGSSRLDKNIRRWISFYIVFYSNSSGGAIIRANVYYRA